MKKKSVGLIVFTTDPANNEIVAILAKRGEQQVSQERGIARESWAGACQVTAHGGVNETEGWASALKREVLEELGWKFYGEVFLPKDRDGVVTSAPPVETEREVVVTFSMLIDHCDVMKISLEHHSGGLRIIRESELSSIRDLPKTYKKETGVTDVGATAMFSDEIEAVRKGFEQAKRMWNLQKHGVKTGDVGAG